MGILILSFNTYHSRNMKVLLLISLLIVGTYSVSSSVLNSNVVKLVQSVDEVDSHSPVKSAIFSVLDNSEIKLFNKIEHTEFGTKIDKEVGQMMRKIVKHVEKEK